MHSNYVEICTDSVCYCSYILRVSGSISLKTDLCHVPHFSYHRLFSLLSPCLLVFPSCKTTNMKISLTSVFYLSQSGKQREKKESEMNTVIQNDSITPTLHYHATVFHTKDKKCRLRELWQYQMLCHSWCNAVIPTQGHAYPREYLERFWFSLVKPLKQKLWL